jgi:hypothetical protein
VSLADIPAAVVTAWAALVSAIATPFTAVFLFVMGRKVEKISEQTDGMNKAMVKLAGEAGRRAGAEQATAVAEVKADALAKGQAQGRAEGKP